MTPAFDYEPKMDAVCATCGSVYGVHASSVCPSGGGVFQLGLEKLFIAFHRALERIREDDHLPGCEFDEYYAIGDHPSGCSCARKIATTALDTRVEP